MVNNKNIKKIEQQRLENSMLGELNRARSVSVGTAFGGVTEISMRGFDSSLIWAAFQPVEVVELIHQLAAGIGCTVDVQPRKDFATWRKWNEDDVGSHPPHADVVDKANNIGTSNL